SGGRIEAVQELNDDDQPLVGVDLSGAFLQDVKLEHANLRRADFSGSDVRRAKLRGAMLEDALLHSTNLRDSDLSEADLGGADRQLASHLAEHSSSGLSGFLLCAADLLEDHELDILFGPIFTPTLDERAELADLLFHWRPSAEELRQIIDEMPKALPFAKVRL